jgi:hypothetical protein
MAFGGGQVEMGEDGELGTREFATIQNAGMDRAVGNDEIVSTCQCCQYS